MLKKIHAFILGVVEFRSTFTTYFDFRLIGAYDAGREFAHAITLRKFEH